MPPLTLVLFCAFGLAAGQYDDPRYSTTTPVPILKQIDRHNEDGSYSFGYEAADGTYKIESKYPTGEIFGKYGFVDDTGKVREVEYGASRRGFEPSGTGINVPPSRFNDNNVNVPDDDGQYREDPSIYYTDPRYTNGERYEPVAERLQHPQRHHQKSAHESSFDSRHSDKLQAVPQPQYQSDYHRYEGRLQPEYETRNYQPTAKVSQTRIQGNPASNVNLNAGSYTINYKR